MYVPASSFPIGIPHNSIIVKYIKVVGATSVVVRHRITPLHAPFFKCESVCIPLYVHLSVCNYNVQSLTVMGPESLGSVHW